MLETTDGASWSALTIPPNNTYGLGVQYDSSPLTGEVLLAVGGGPLVLGSTKALYRYDDGVSAWNLFPVQPPWPVASTGSYFAAGLPNGEIIVNDGPNAGYFPDKYLHFDPTTAAWSQVQKPLPVIHPKVSFVRDDNLVVLGATTREIDIWDGVSYSRAPSGMTAGALRGIAAASSTDIWCTTDTTALWHLESGSWVNRWDEARIALGGTNLFFKGVWYVDGAYYFISNDFTGYNGKISKWTPGGGFSLVALIGAPSPGNSTITCDIWARAADDIWVFGYWSNDEVWHWNGSTVTRKFEAPSRKLNMFYSGDHLIHGTDSNPYMFGTTPDNGGAWYESTDTGASWLPITWIDGNRLFGLGKSGDPSSAILPMPTSADWECMDISETEMPDVLITEGVQASRGAPWFSIDGNDDLVIYSDDGTESILTIELPISSTFSFETTFKMSDLPLDLSQLDKERFFVGVYDKQDNAGGVLLSRNGLAMVAAFGTQALTLPGSQNIFDEGEDYWTMRFVVRGDIDRFDLYLTKTDELPATGHVLRYTSAAPVTPPGSLDEVRIEILGQSPTNQTVGKFSTLRCACFDALIPNQRPIADAGADQAANIGSAVTHDGRNSYDPEGAALTYDWALISAPEGSRFKISGSGSTIDDGDADGFTDVFNGGTEAFSEENAPLLQPGDHLLVGGVLHRVSSDRWVLDPVTNKYVRDDPGTWNDDELVITTDTLPDNLSGAAYDVLHTITYFSDSTQPFPSAIPDIAGLYDVQLVVNDGELDSLPATALLNITQTSVPLGCIPEVGWIWNYLADFWNLLEDREVIETVWSGFAQAAAAQLLVAWQVDYNKSLKDIQRVFQRRWLDYDTVLDVEPDDAEIRIIRGPLLTQAVTAGVLFDSSNNELQVVFDGGGIETVTFSAGLLTPTQIASEINTQLGFTSDLSVLATVVNDGLDDYVQLDYASLLRIRPNGTANTVLGFSATEYTNNDLRGNLGAAISVDALRAFEATHPPVLNFDDAGIGPNDLLVKASVGYRVQKTALDAATGTLTTGLSLLDDLPDTSSEAWEVPSVVVVSNVSGDPDFDYELVIPKDLVIFEVKDLTSPSGQATSEVLCEIVGVRANRIGFDPQPLLEMLNGEPGNYEVICVGVKHTQALPVDDLVLEVPRLQEIIKNPQITFDMNTDYLIDDSLGRNAIQFRDGTFSLTDPPPDTFWAEVTYLDNRPTIEANFGRLVNFTVEDMESRTDDLDYLSAVRGLWWAYFGGPSLDKVRTGVQILLGLPFAEEEGTVTSIEPNFSTTEGRIVMEDAIDNNVVRTYFYPLDAGLAINQATGEEIKEGDLLPRFAPLSGGIEVRDWVQTPYWLAKYVSMGKYGELDKYFKFLVRGDVDTFNVANMVLAIDFVRKIKPHYTWPLFVLLKRLKPTEVDVDDEFYIAAKLKLVDSTCPDEPGAFRYDDTNEGLPGPPGSHQTVQPGVQGLPTNWIHQYDAGPGTDGTAFLYDLQSLCPAESLWVHISYIHPGSAGWFYDTIWAYDDGDTDGDTISDDRLPLSGPDSSPPAPYGPLVGVIDYDATVAAGTYHRERNL
jgi:hypothetical protein